MCSVAWISKMQWLMAMNNEKAKMKVSMQTREICSRISINIISYQLIRLKLSIGDEFLKAQLSTRYYVQIISLNWISET